MAQLHIKTGDTVVVLSGSSKGVRGEVIATSPKENKVIVKDANMIKKHVKARRQGDVSGIIDAEGAMYASKVALYCPKCGKGVRTNAVVDGDKKIRTCKKCGHKFD